MSRIEQSQDKRTPWLTKETRLLLTSAAWFLVNHAPHFLQEKLHYEKHVLTEESRKNIEIVAQELDKGANAVFFANHLRYTDGPVGLYVLSQAKPDEVAAPVAKKHYDKNVNFFKILERFGAHAFVVVNPGDDANAAVKAEKFKKYITDIATYLGGSHRILGTYPEATRNKQGYGLQQAQNGIGYFHLSDPDGKCLYVPMGYVPGEVTGQKYTEIRVGVPFHLKDLIPDLEFKTPEEITTILMKELAKILPDKMRGVYGP